ncbi:SdrD B-like domain-containing protein [Leifsonia sp. NCR5]|uniref:SdrD B-like domain-containing protein n=1 Tax=Leifsonia sp. NCR5 TaxID=1978342 RepID=UPI000A1909DB|nr:SdrD B-like domain-containing protein [Leifsonia sp. NCR5]
MNVTYSSRLGTRKKRIGWAAIALSALLAASLPALPALASSAAMSATIEAIDDTVKSGGQAVYRVAYQCSNLTTDSCIAPTFTVPTPGGTGPNGEPAAFGGEAVLGGGAHIVSATGSPLTIGLRDLGPGESGEFTISWPVANFTTLPGTTFPATIRLGYADAAAPDGQVTTQVTTARPVVVEAKSALTVVKQMKTPIRETLVRPDEPVTYAIYGCNPNAASLGALDYTDLVLVDSLPKGTTFVSASDGGVYDPIAETVTWTTPAPARDDCMNPTQVRELTVIYSDETFVQSIPKGELINAFQNKVEATAVALDGTKLSAFDQRNHTFLAPDSERQYEFVANKNASHNNYLHSDTTSEYQWGMLTHWHGNVPGYDSANLRPAVVLDRMPCLVGGQAVSPAMPASDPLGMSFPGAISIPSDQCTNPAFSTEQLRFDERTASHLVQVEVVTWNGVMPQTHRYVKPADKVEPFRLNIHRPSGAPNEETLGLPVGEVVTDLRIVSIGEDNVGDWWAVRGVNTQAFADTGLLTMANTYVPFYGVEFAPGASPVAGIAGTGSPRAAAEYFASPSPDPQVVKVAASDVSGLRPGVAASWTITIANGANGKVPLRPMLVDVLPIGLELDESTISWTNLDAVGKPTLKQGTVTIGGRSHRTLTWTWPEGTALGVGDPQPTVTFDTDVTLAATEGAHANDDAQRAVLFDMDYTLSNKGTGVATDVDDLNGNGDTEEMVSESTVGWTVLASAGAAIEKTVKGALDADWTRGGLTNATFDGNGTHVDYRLAVTNPNNTALKDLVIYDVLPHVGDTAISGVLEGAERGSAWEVTFGSILSMPAGATIEYSTSNDPCRPELFDRPAGQALPAGCDADWSATLPEDPASVRALRVVFADLAPALTPEYIEYRTIAPALSGANDLAVTDPAAVANNNVAWQTSRVTNAGATAAVLASEAPVVGARRVAGQLGDRVWLDADRNGVQDAGEVGVPGITLELRDENGQPVTAADGQPVRTSTDKNGEYVFTVPLGTWSVAIVGLPAEYELTAHHAGTDTAADSDFTGVGVATAPVTIADPVRNGEGANIVTTLDAGLVRAGVTITKDDGLTVVHPGESITYTITVTNTAAQAVAKAVAVADALPAELDFVGATESGAFDEDDRVITWALGDLAPGETRILEVTATVWEDISPDTEIANVATITGTFDCVTDCAASDVDRTPPSVSIVKDDNRTTVGNGETLRYDLFVENGSSSATATGVTVVDTLPEHLEFVDASDDGVYDEDARTVTWTLGDLAPGSGRVVQVHATVAVTTPAGSTITNTATVETTEGCIVDDECRTEDVDHTPDVSIAKDDNEEVVAIGQDLTYDLTVTNGAAWDAPLTVVTDVLPDTVEFVSATDDGEYDEETRTITWELGTLDADSERAVSVTARVVDGLEDGDTIVNTATVTTEHGCADDARCSSTDTDTVEVPKPGELDDELDETEVEVGDPTPTATPSASPSVPPTVNRSDAPRLGSQNNGSTTAGQKDGLANTGSTVATLAGWIGGLLLLAGAVLLLIRRRKAYGTR